MDVTPVNPLWGWPRNLLELVHVQSQDSEGIQLKEIIGQKVEVVLLDNMTPGQVKNCLKIVNGRFECEASGKINLKNLLSYAKIKINRISIGQLTHSINNVDFGLDI